ncbi:MAG: cytochrome-c oxidase, cbb3-type subunit I [Tepidisphaeraceae bacterium]
MSQQAVVKNDTSPQSSPASAKLDEFKYDDQIVRMFLAAMMIFGVVAFLVGLVIALQLAFPTIPGTDIPTNFGLPFLTFGRLRPLHTNAAIFAFVGNCVFAAVYYSTQRLLKTRMWSDKLSRLHFWGWQLIIVLAAVSLPLGYTQGKEYAELEWPIDLMIAVVWLVFFGGNFLMTLLNRRERHIYVAIWFYIASIVTVTILHVFNSLAVPVLSGTTIKSYSLYAGAQDAMMQWWYGHNAVAFFLTTPILGLMYYFVPKAAERPVFSYRLSILHFWSIVFVYIWAGPHHLHYSPIADWASTLGMIFSIMLWMPSWGGMINGFLTLRGAWHKVTSDPVLKFFVVGITFYGMSTFEGPLLSIKSVNALSHYTDWTIAHVHSGALGWNGCMAFGMMYWLLPRLFQTKLWSTKAAEWHFWAATIGILLYIIPIYWAGITQGLMWRQIDGNGALVHPQFVETVNVLIPFYYLRAIGGTVFIVGALIGCVNYFMTWMSRPKTYEEPIHTAPPLSAVPIHDPVSPISKLQAVTDSAKKLDVFASLWWHRKWERMPVFFTVMCLIAVLVASAFSLVPSFVIRSNIPTIASVKPYTPLELYGRDIYIREGCYNCHSQNIRPILAEVKRYGGSAGFSKPGEFVYDHPFQWGSRRIGPDLQREGGRQSNGWHYQHFEKPSSVVNGSIMPPYAFLQKSTIGFDTIQARMKSMAMLGVPYTSKDIATAVENAKTQATMIAGSIAQDIIRDPDSIKEMEARQDFTDKMQNADVVALIAYLQRMGTDIGKTDPNWKPDGVGQADTAGSASVIDTAKTEGTH